jgi:hypothetical protein
VFDANNLGGARGGRGIVGLYVEANVRVSAVVVPEVKDTVGGLPENSVALVGSFGTSADALPVARTSADEVIPKKASALLICCCCVN